MTDNTLYTNQNHRFSGGFDFGELNKCDVIKLAESAKV